VLHGEAKATLSNGTVIVNAPPGQYHYAVSIPLPGLPRGSAVQIDLIVRTGQVGVGCTDPALGRYVSGEPVAHARERTTLTLLPEEEDVVLVVRNWTDHPAEVVIHQVRVEPASALPAARIKATRAGRYPYWHYSFDLGDGVIIEANIEGQMPFQRLNNRIMMALIDKFFDPVDIRTVLDVACSSGFHTIELARRGWTVSAIDIDPTQIEQAKLVQENIEAGLNLHYEVGDLMNYEAEPADLIHCSGLFYHLSDLVGAAHRLFKLCKRGAVVQSAVDGFEGEFLSYGDPSKFFFCGDYEFAFVPTAPMLARIFRHVGFSDVRHFSTLDLVAEIDLDDLTPNYQRIMQTQNAYFVLRK
jgi:SAM-dependent methyltransferase